MDSLERIMVLVKFSGPDDVIFAIQIATAFFIWGLALETTYDPQTGYLRYAIDCEGSYEGGSVKTCWGQLATVLSEFAISRFSCFFV